MRWLLAIDPGETCGWGLFGCEEFIACGEMEWKELYSFLEERLDVYDLDNGLVLIEDYRIRTDTVSANLGKELITVKVIGVIEFLCERYGVECDTQPAGIGEKFFTRERMEDLGVWIVGKPHARSAIKHGLYWLRFGRD